MSRRGELPIGVSTNKTTRLDSWRNRVAGKTANFVLRFATDDYRALIAGSIKYGVRAAARDQREGREAP